MRKVFNTKLIKTWWELNKSSILKADMVKNIAQNDKNGKKVLYYLFKCLTKYLAIS